jgi:hypothetical protein
MTAFWDIAPCSLVEVDRRFTGTYCLHHHALMMIIEDVRERGPEQTFETKSK